MSNFSYDRKPFISALLAAVPILFLVACSGGSGGADTLSISGENIFPPSTRTATGKIVSEAAQQSGGAGTSDGTLNMSLTLDGDTDEISFDSQGNFELENLSDGNHTLYVHHGDNTITDIPFRMLSGRGIGMGTITIREGHVEDHTGFDGYLFGFVDEDNDGINDRFSDTDGDGICDTDMPYAGYPYLMDMGYIDANGDGINDRFQDADGDGRNDVDGMFYGHGFGFADENDDGINDHFIDEDGDGICDLTGMPFSHPFGYKDEDGDGINDLFIDSDGDGVNDITDGHYIAMPGWVDLDGDGANDFFRDADGNGINDMMDGRMSFAHGFGWVDIDNNGVNDHFVDTNGDRINDLENGPYANMFYNHGFIQAHQDADGNGIDDISGMPYHHGFGWIDADNDGINDTFVDAAGDGINDRTGHHYDVGYAADHNMHEDQMDDTIDWPMPGTDHGMM